LCLLVLPLYSYAMTCPQGTGFSAPQGGLKGEEPYFFTPEGICCYQRCKTDPPQRLKIDPGVNLLL
ncbi:hypothetical protein NQT76_54345, partial [Klebsiella sp. KJ_S1]|nr:hypothetical protein [Klebsiella sp. KJ_S1]